jgi:hypothetical protein
MKDIFDLEIPSDRGFAARPKNGARGGEESSKFLMGRNCLFHSAPLRPQTLVNAAI